MVSSWDHFNHFTKIELMTTAVRYHYMVWIGGQTPDTENSTGYLTGPKEERFYIAVQLKCIKEVIFREMSYILYTFNFGLLKNAMTKL